MYRHQLRIAAVATVLAVLAVAASAQVPSRVRIQRGRGGAIVTRDTAFAFDLRRGRMGITVDMRADAARDSIGARVAGVTPGGPADRAGVQTGDLVTRVNGTRLIATEGREEDEGDQSRPALRLLRLASRLDPGDTVRLEVRRDSRPLSFTFVTEESDVDRFIGRMRMPGGMEPGGVMPLMQGEGQMRIFAFGGPLASVELVKVNPGLGEYFGTSEGLLVVDVGQDTTLGLRAGDVILSIGGRRSSSPPQAMRILGTYEPNEAVQFEVMRQRHRVTVNGKMPAGRQGEWRVRPNSFEFEFPRLPTEPMRRMFEMELPSLERMMPRMQMFMRPPTRNIGPDETPPGLIRVEVKT